MIEMERNGMKYRCKKRVRLQMLLLMVLLPVICFIVMPLQAKAAVRLNAEQKTLVIGNDYRLKVRGTSKKVTWRTSNKKIATVSQTGLVSAKRSGTATITAKVGKKKLKCKIVVITQQKSYVNKTIRLINKERRKYGYSSFDKNATLQAAAEKRAKELATKFSHTRPNGYQWTSAISMKYDFKYAAENIACDFATPQQTVEAWMKSATTKSKIISKKYNEIGVGVYLGKDGYLYWCAIFGKEK